jgi:hypothetical protein
VEQYEIIAKTKEYLKYMGGVANTIAELQAVVNEKKKLLAMDPAARIAHMSGGGGRSSAAGSSVENEADHSDRLQADIDRIEKRIAKYRAEYDEFMDVLKNKVCDGDIKSYSCSAGLYNSIVARYFPHEKQIPIPEYEERWARVTAKRKRIAFLSIGSIMKGWRDEEFYYYAGGKCADMTPRQIKEQREIDAYNARLKAQGVHWLT